MNMTRKYFGEWLSLVLILLAAGCAIPVKQAIHLDAEFKAPEISEITLLPTLDLRVDRDVNVDTQKAIREDGMSRLKKKGYQVVLHDNLGGMAEITEYDLKSGDPNWIKRLGPSEARWVMVLVLVDVKTKLTFGSTGNAEVAGFLYDKERGVIVWRDKGIGQVGQGGLVGMMMKGMMDDQAISAAMFNLLSSIPNRAR